MDKENSNIVNDTVDLDAIRELLGEQKKETAEETAQDETSVLQEPQQEMTAPDKKKDAQSFAQEVYSMLHDVVYILSIVTIIFVFVVRLVGVDGESMLPTLHNRDFVLLESNFLYGPEDVEHGDIVVLSVPYYADQGPIVKRVIATEGQTVDIDFDLGVVYVDGKALDEDYTNALTHANWDEPYALQYPATVPENCIFVLGDNRNESTDSRFAPVGMIDESCILGKVFLIVWPGQTSDHHGNVIDPRDWSRIGTVA